MPFGNLGPNAIEKTYAAGIAGRMRHVISPASRSHHPDVKRPIASERTARLTRVMGRPADSADAPRALAGVGSDPIRGADYNLCDAVSHRRRETRESLNSGR